MNQGTVFDFPDAKGIVVCGDIHGEFNQLVFKCCVQYGMTDTVIIVAGDCGFCLSEATTTIRLTLMISPSSIADG